MIIYLPGKQIVNFVEYGNDKKLFGSENMNINNDNNILNRANNIHGPKKERSWRDFWNELAILYMNDYWSFFGLEIFVVVIGIFVIMAYSLVLEFF